MLLLPDPSLSHPFVQLDFILAIFRPFFNLEFSFFKVLNSFTQYVADYYGYHFVDNSTATAFTDSDLGHIKMQWATKNEDAPLCQDGQTASINYSGTFLKTGYMFDSNTDPKFKHDGKPFEFVIGKHIVIECWDYAAARMSPGSKARFLCPS